MKRLGRSLSLLPLLAMLGCSEPAPEDSEAHSCSFELDWGSDGSSGFVPFQDGDHAEIVMGFQGFRYVQSAMRLSSVSAEVATFSIRIEVDGHEPYSLSDAPAKLSPRSDGALYAERVLVFFNDLPLPQIVGRGALVSTRAVAAGCVGLDAAQVMLVDEQDCLELSDGSLECGP